MDKDNWFSGFTDGEGSFIIARRKSGACAPRFAIRLRADDIGILKCVQETFGGNLCGGTPPPLYRNDKEYIGKPQIALQIVAKRYLIKLVNYFDKFPLRSKKARDFKLWREAVEIYVKWGWSDKRLPVLYQAIREGREFDAIYFPEPDLGPEQLDFGGVFSVPGPN